MRIFFARHGETDWNIAKRIQGTTDTHLNENGFAQARALATDLQQKNANLVKIFSSKQIRAYETAQTVGDIFQVPVEGVDGLEEMNLGIWEGHTWKEVEEQYPKELEYWLTHRRYGNTPGGESYQQVLERLFKALDDIFAELGIDESNVHEKQGDILVVSHGAVIINLLALQRDVPCENMTSVIEVENAKAFTLEYEEVRDTKRKL